jgi:hypothetical protein
VGAEHFDADTKMSQKTRADARRRRGEDREKR